MNKLPRNLFHLILLVILTSGCGEPQSEVGSETNPRPIPIPEVTVVITPDNYTAPDSLHAGYVTIVLENNTQEMHSAHLIRLDDGYSEDQLIEAYADASRTRGTRPEWMTHRGGPLGEPGTSRLTMDLEPGNYAWVCVMGPDTIPHFTGHEHQSVTVHAIDTDTESPGSPDAVIRMTDENHELSQPLSAGPQSVEITNSGTKYHLAALAILNDGATAEEYMNWFTNPNGPPPAQGVAATSAIGPGLSARLDLELEPGEYVLFCFANADGVPHLFQGAIQTFTVE